jgi:glycosyltransferase involved in cell wall biosynthesis
MLTCSGPDRGVFESQVLEYGRLLRTLGVEFRYLVFEGVRGWWHDRRETERRVAELERRFDARIAVHALPMPLSRLGLALGARAVAGAAPAPSAAPLLIQARNPEGTCIALEARRTLRRAVVIHDARGDVVAEARMTAEQARSSAERRHWERRARRLEALERRACAEADHHLAVSTALRDRLVALGAERDAVTVVPCCVDPSRFATGPDVREAVRTRLGLAGRVVLAYVGSLGVWQVPDRVAALVARVRARLPQTHLLVVTAERTEAERAFADLVARSACTIVEARYDDIGRYLAAADAALLLREDHPVNRVASPVKFAEYQAAGLPVIASDRLGDVGSYLRETGHGVVLSADGTPDDHAEAVVRALETGGWAFRRDGIRRAAARSFARTSYRDHYVEVLQRLGILSGPSRAAAS